MRLTADVNGERVAVRAPYLPGGARGPGWAAVGWRSLKESPCHWDAPMPWRGGVRKSRLWSRDCVVGQGEMVLDLERRDLD